MKLNNNLKNATRCFKIGIAGAKGSGKSYLARKLSEIFQCPIMSFAAPVKYLAGFRSNPFNIFTDTQTKQFPLNFIFDVFYGFSLFPSAEEKPRKLLQYIGQRGRHYDPDIWVKYAVNSIDSNIVIFDDLRYDNETLIMDYVIEIESDYTHEHESECGYWRIFDGDWYYRDITVPQRSSIEPILKDFHEKITFNTNIGSYTRF